MKLLALLIGLAIAAAVAWNAGEQHRKNCISEKKTDCSVLPWQDGKAKRSPNTLDRQHKGF
jgi:hypothetical protein